MMLSRGRLTVFTVGLVEGHIQPVVAQTAPTTPAQETAADADVLTGLERLGAIADQSVECASEATWAGEIGRVSGIGDDVAVEYSARPIIRSSDPSFA